MIVPFPFVFLTGGWGFGVAGEISGNNDLKTVSRYLVPAGLVAGLLAAVPGIMDYLGSVPPKSSAKERATTHALLNVTSLALFSLGWLAGKTRNRYLPLTFESVGVTTLSMAGWLGGTLVYRNQIGVDHRYANAGKWQEDTVSADGTKTLLKASATFTYRLFFITCVTMGCPEFLHTNPNLFWNNQRVMLRNLFGIVYTNIR